MAARAPVRVPPDLGSAAYATFDAYTAAFEENADPSVAATDATAFVTYVSVAIGASDPTGPISNLSVLSLNTRS